MGSNDVVSANCKVNNDILIPRSILKRHEMIDRRGKEGLGDDIMEMLDG